MTRMTTNRVLLSAPGSSPFRLDETAAYERWRAQKLAQRPALDELLVPLADPFAVSPAEKARIQDLCRRCNMAIYKVSDGQGRNDKAMLHRLGLQFGLSRLDDNLRADEDDITSLTVTEQSGNRYIPYTNKPLSWHTDGYYNAAEAQVRGIILHCAQPTATGGENALIDHELVYMQLRDENPDYIEALMHPEAMTIPPNVEQGSEIRGACSGPVFSVDADTGSLHMRYSARKRNIVWRDDELTRAAADLIKEVLDNQEITYRYRLGAGEGLICNNVLHRRTGFEDSAEHKRLMYRARYYDRITGTGLNRVAD